MISMDEYADLGLTEEDIKKLNICFLGTKKTPSKLIASSKDHVETTPKCRASQKNIHLDVDEWSDSSGDFDDKGQISAHCATSSSPVGGDRGYFGGCGRGNFLHNELQEGRDYGSHVPSYVHFRRMEQELRPLFNMVDSAQFRNDTLEQYFAENKIKSPPREQHSPCVQNVQELKEMFETNSSNTESESPSPEQTLFRKKSSPELKVKTDTNGCVPFKEQGGATDHGKLSCDRLAAQRESFKNGLLSTSKQNDENVKNSFKEPNVQLYIPPALRKRNSVTNVEHVKEKLAPKLDLVPPNDCPALQTKIAPASKKSMAELCKRNALLNSLRRQKEEDARGCSSSPFVNFSKSNNPTVQHNSYSSRSNVISSSLETGSSQQDSTKCLSSPPPASDISEHHLASSLLYSPIENEQYFASPHSFNVVERVPHPACPSPDCLIPAESVVTPEVEDGSNCFYYYDPDTEQMVKYRIPGEIADSSQPLKNFSEHERRKNTNTWPSSYHKKYDFEFESEEFPPLH